MLQLSLRLKGLIEKKGLMQIDIAQDLNFTRTQINNWCVDRAKPKYEELIILAEYFGVTTDYLLGLSDSEEQDIIKSSGNAVALPEDEIALLEEYRAASSEHKKNILTIAKSFAYQDKQATQNKPRNKFNG